MEITDIRVKKILTDSTAESRMKAVVSVTFDDSFVVHDIKIIEGQDKLFTAMPSRKTQEGEFKTFVCGRRKRAPPDGLMDWTLSGKPSGSFSPWSGMNG